MSSARQNDTRESIKRAARRLFIDHGIEHVSVRDILTAAGQRNIGAVGYYFQTKDALVEEILLDGAKVIDDRRNALVDALEARAGQITLRDVLSAIISPLIDVNEGREDNTYNRFFLTFLQRTQIIFTKVAAKGLDRGYIRCVEHIRRLLPDHPRSVLNERILMVMLMIGTGLSLRESMQEAHRDDDIPNVYGGRIWISDTLVDNLIDAGEGALRQPMAIATSALVRSRHTVTKQH